MYDFKKDISDELFEKLKPHLSGLSLGEINILMSHISDDDFETFTEYIKHNKNKHFKVFYDINKQLLKEYMR